MYIYQKRYSILFKAIAIAIVCAFLVNDIAWAQPSDYNPPEQSTLAVQSRFKHFFEKHGLDFQSMAGVIYAAGRLKELLIDQNVLDDTTIKREINHLNRLFPEGAVKIREEIQNGRLRRADGKESKAYKYAILDFVKEAKTINVLFLADHTNLTDNELRQLRVVKEDENGLTIDERYHLDYLGLEGVWFVNQASVSAMSAGPQRLAGQQQAAVSGGTANAARASEDRTSAKVAFRNRMASGSGTTQKTDYPTVDMIDRFFYEYETRPGVPSEFREYDGRPFDELINTVLKRNMEKIVIVGDSIPILPIYLSLLGKDVYYVDMSEYGMNDIRHHWEIITEEFRRKGFKGPYKFETIYEEIGALNMKKNGLAEHSYDLVTLIDLAWDYRGKPKKWFETAGRLLKDDGYIVVDDITNESSHRWPVLKAFDAAFPEAQKITKRNIIGSYSFHDGTSGAAMYRIDSEHRARANETTVAPEAKQAASANVTQFFDEITQSHPEYANDIMISNMLADFLSSITGMKRNSEDFTRQKDEFTRRLARYFMEKYPVLNAQTEAEMLIAELTTPHAMEITREPSEVKDWTIANFETLLNKTKLPDFGIHIYMWNRRRSSDSFYLRDGKFVKSDDNENASDSIINPDFVDIIVGLHGNNVDFQPVKDFLKSIEPIFSQYEFEYADHYHSRIGGGIVQVHFRMFLRKNHRPGLFPQAKAPRPDGYIAQGDRALAKFEKQIMSNATDEYKGRVVTLLKQLLESGIALSDAERYRIEDIMDRLGGEHGQISTFRALIEDPDDFVLGEYGNYPYHLHIAKDLLTELDTRGPPGTRLGDEYIIHELLCRVFGHYHAILFQQELFSGRYKGFPDHYPDKNKLETQDPLNPYKGELGVTLRRFIDERHNRQNIIKPHFKEITEYNFREPTDIIKKTTGQQIAVIEQTSEEAVGDVIIPTDEIGINSYYTNELNRENVRGIIATYKEEFEPSLGVMWKPVERVVGVLLYELDPFHGTIHIIRMKVKPDYKDRGIETAFIEHLDELYSKDYVKVTADVFEHFDELIKTMRDCGFKGKRIQTRQNHLYIQMACKIPAPKPGEARADTVKRFSDFYPALSPDNVQTLTADRTVYVTVDFSEPVSKNDIRLIVRPLGNEHFEDIEATHINDYGSSHRFKFVLPANAKEYALEALSHPNSDWHWMGGAIRIVGAETVQKVSDVSPVTLSEETKVSEVNATQSGVSRNSIQKSVTIRFGPSPMDGSILTVTAFRRKSSLPYSIVVRQEGNVRRDTSKAGGERFMGGKSLTGEYYHDQFITAIKEPADAENLIDKILEEYRRVNPNDTGNLHAFRAWILGLPEIIKDDTQNRVGDIRFSGTMDRVEDIVNPSNVTFFHEVPLKDVPSRMFVYRRNRFDPIRLRIEMRFDTAGGPLHGKMVMEAITDMFTEDELGQIYLFAGPIFEDFSNIVSGNVNSEPPTSLTKEHHVLLMFFRPVIKMMVEGDDFSSLTYVTLRDFDQSELKSAIIRFEGLHSEKQVGSIYSKAAGMRSAVKVRIPANALVTATLYSRDYYEDMIGATINDIGDKIEKLPANHLAKTDLTARLRAAEEKFEKLMPDEQHRTVVYPKWIEDLNEWQKLKDEIDQIFETAKLSGQSNYYSQLIKGYPHRAQDIDRLGHSPEVSNILAGWVLGKIDEAAAINAITKLLGEHDTGRAMALLAQLRNSGPLNMAKEPQEPTTSSGATEDVSIARIRTMIEELISDHSRLEKAGLMHAEIGQIEQTARLLVVENRFRIIDYDSFIIKVENGIIWIDKEALGEVSDVELKAELLHELVHLLPDQLHRMGGAYDWHERIFNCLKRSTRDYEERMSMCFSQDDRGKEYRRALEHLMYSKIRSEAKAYRAEILYLQTWIASLLEYLENRRTQVKKEELRETYTFLLKLLNPEGRIDEKNLHVKQVLLFRYLGDLSMFAQFLFFEKSGRYDGRYYAGWETEKEYENELWQWLNAYDKKGPFSKGTEPRSSTMGILFFELAAAEVNRIHSGNLKYTPALTANTVLCHITAPSTLPDGQQGILNRLESGMRGREYSEKMLELKTSSSGDFIEQVKDTIQKAQETYKEIYGKDYVNHTFKFDVACPSLDLVERVQNELNLPALAFAPQEGEGNMVQVENIMLALRALQISIETNDIKSLIDAYAFVTGNNISSSIKDIAEFAKTMLFAMPKINVNELGRINALIEENIKTAA